MNNSNKSIKNGTSNNNRTNVNNINKMTTQRNRIQSMSNDVITNSPVSDSGFQIVQSKPKNNLSSTSTDSSTDKNKKKHAYIRNLK